MADVKTGKEVAPSPREEDPSKGINPSDWVMAEAEVPGRPSSETKVEQRDNLKKVEEETLLLMKKLAEVDAKRADLTLKVKGKTVYDELQAHRQPVTNIATRMPTAENEGVGALWKNMQGSNTSAMIAARKVAIGSGPRVVASSGQAYVMSGSAGSAQSQSKTQETVMRKLMYDKQVENGVFNAGPRCKYDIRKMTEQTKCKHAFEGLKWKGNAKSLYASCGKCGITSVVLYRKLDEPETGAYASQSPAEPGACTPKSQGTTTTFMVNDVHVVILEPGTIMVDTGCKKSLGGKPWHKGLQQAMDNIGMTYRSFAMEEMFQFGPGEPMNATKGWRYNVGINGKCEVLEIAEVDVDIPGLCGPDDMARWSMKLDFSDDTMETNGKKRPLLPSRSGHPCVSLLAFQTSNPNIIITNQMMRRSYPQKLLFSRQNLNRMMMHTRRLHPLQTAVCQIESRTLQDLDPRHHTYIAQTKVSNHRAKKARSLKLLYSKLTMSNPSGGCQKERTAKFDNISNNLQNAQN